MSKELDRRNNRKIKFKEFKNLCDQLPPYDDEDQFFVEMSDSNKFLYLYMSLKQTLQIFLTQKVLMDNLIESVSDLEAKIIILERKK